MNPLERKHQTEQKREMRILVVDDDIHQLRSIKRFLNAAGLSVITSTSTKEAIIALEGIPFDTVLSDIQMPGADGITLIKWIDKNLPHIPVYAMTAYGSDEIYRDVLQHGAVVYLEKPVDLKLLVQLLATSKDNCKSGNSFVTACLEATSLKGSGEVIVHNNNQIGQIFFYKGKIAWATVQHNPQSFIDILCAGRAFDKKELAQLIQDCRQQGTDVFSELVSNRFIKQHEMKAILHRYISTCFTQCLQWKNAQAMFIASSRRFSGQISFELADILTLANTTKDLRLR